MIQMFIYFHFFPSIMLEPVFQRTQCALLHVLISLRKSASSAQIQNTTQGVPLNIRLYTHLTIPP